MRAFLFFSAHRVSQLLLVLWAIVTLSFFAVVVLPGDPVAMIVGGETRLRPEILEQIEKEYGLDKPVHQQYLDYLSRFARGDFGTSYSQQRPVTELIVQNIRPTVELAVLATIMAVGLAFLFALFTAGQGRLSAGLASAVELVTLSAPAFFVALLLIFFLSFKLKLFPVVNASGLSGAVLPALTLAISTFGLMAQLLRVGMENALRQPFALTARARGMRSLGVKAVHALRHATLPVLTMSGTMIGNLLGGAVITESIFGRPGLGRLTLDAVQNRDMPMVIGVILVTAILFMAVSIIVDILSGVVDPRLRLVNARVGAAS